MRFVQPPTRGTMTTYTDIMTTLREKADLDLSWARLTSNLLSPPVMWGGLAVPIAFKVADTTSQAVMWAGIYILFACLLPLAFVAWMVWRGSIGDMHMENRRERFWPFALSIVFMAMAAGLYYTIEAPPVMWILALFGLFQIAITALITLVWQVSMHTMSVTGATIAVELVFGLETALLTVPLILLVSAARLKLKRHTPAQIIGGVLVGGLVPALLLLMMV